MYFPRNNQRSLEKRKKIQDWMAKKRTERHATWKNEVEELRSTEFKPFTTATEVLLNNFKLGKFSIKRWRVMHIS